MFHDSAGIEIHASKLSTSEKASSSTQCPSVFIQHEMVFSLRYCCAAKMANVTGSTLPMQIRKRCWAAFPTHAYTYRLLIRCWPRCNAAPKRSTREESRHREASTPAPKPSCPARYRLHQHQFQEASGGFRLGHVSVPLIGCDQSGRMALLAPFMIALPYESARPCQRAASRALSAHERSRAVAEIVPRSALPAPRHCRQVGAWAAC